MKINLIRYANSMDPNAPYLKDSEAFIEDINNELFDEDYELVENTSESPLNIIFIETGGSEQSFIKDYEKYSAPIVLISHCKNNSLPACLEISTFLDSKGIDCILLFGEPKQVSQGILRLNKVVTAKDYIDNANLGVIGAPSDWLIASRVDYKVVKEKFNINLVDITTEELKEEIEKDLLPNIPRKAELEKCTFDSKVLQGAFKIYSGIKRIVEKYHLKGFTLRCFDLLTEYKNTSCLAFALLNEEGIVAACEGDVPSLLTMFIVRAINSGSSFMANPSQILIEESSLLFAHCTVPFNMCKKYQLMTHFESDMGIGVRGELKPQTVTVVKLRPDLKGYLLATGEIKDNLNLPNYCRTQIKVEFDYMEFIQFMREKFGNHVIIAYGDITNELLALMEMYKIGKKEE